MPIGNKDFQELAYKYTGSLKETTDFMVRAIEEDDWQTYSNITASTAQELIDISRIAMGLAAYGKEGE